MHVYFSEIFNFSDLKKDVLSNLIGKRVILLLGERKATRINNIYFLNTDSFAEKETSTVSVLPNEVAAKWFDGKINIYFNSDVLNKLLHQGPGHLLFDRAIITISNDIHFNL